MWVGINGSALCADPASILIDQHRSFVLISAWGPGLGSTRRENDDRFTIPASLYNSYNIRLVVWCVLMPLSIDDWKSSLLYHVYFIHRSIPVYFPHSSSIHPSIPEAQYHSLRQLFFPVIPSYTIHPLHPSLHQWFFHPSIFPSVHPCMRMHVNWVIISDLRFNKHANHLRGGGHMLLRVCVCVCLAIPTTVSRWYVIVILFCLSLF